jgi:DNA repair exonuclease SbcCD ATPase subunit
MFVKEIELVGFKPFSLHRIDSFKHEFDSKITILVGDSGSGKSSLVKQLLPHTFDPKLFRDDGYKKLTIYKNSDIFEIHNYLEGKTPYYSIKKNDEELNPSHNVTSFKTVVDREFNLNQDTSQLLLGNVGFTDLNSTKRREWLMSFTQEALNEAFLVYDAAKDKLREYTIILKHLSQEYIKLQAERSKLTDLESLDEINKLNDMVRNCISVLPSRPNGSLNELIDDYKAKEKMLSESVKEVRELSKYLPYNLPTEDTSTSSEAVIEILKAKLASLYEKKFNYEKELTELESAINAISESHDGENVLFRLSEVEQKIEDLTGHNHYGQAAVNTLSNDALGVFASYVDSFIENHGEIIDELIRLEEAEGVSVHDAEVKASYELKMARENSTLKDSELARLKAEYDEQTKQKEHVVKCTNCDHDVYVNFNEEHYANLAIKLKTAETEKLNAEANLRKATAKSEAIASWKAMHEAYVRSYTIFISKAKDQSLKDILTEVFSDIRDTKRLLRNLSLTAADTIRVKQFLSERDQLVSIKKVFENNQATTKDSLVKRFNSIQDNYTDVQTKIALTEEDIIYEERRNDLIASAKMNSHKLKKLCAELKKLQEDIAKHLEHEGAMEVVQTIMVYTDKAVKEAAARQALIDNIEELNRKIKETSSMLEQFEFLERSLSPKNGIIANQLTNYLNSLLSEMNKVIERIWRYDLSIKAVNIEVENKSLDFKLAFNYEGNVVPDIKDASSGMKEVIELSFRIVMMNCLRLIGYPIVLDEYAARMDPEHRKVAFSMVEELSHSSLFSQMLIISHDYSTYGRLSNTCLINLNTYEQ